MEFTAIIGDRGAGKTCYLTSLLRRHHASGQTVVSNYHLNFPHVKMAFQDIRALPKELHRTVVGLDELAIGADSYDFFSKSTRELTTFVAEIRKRQCIVYFTTQRFSMIAKRLRLQTDGFIFMEDVDKNAPLKFGQIHRDVCAGVFNIYWADSNLRIVNRKSFLGRNYWDMYDTDEIIRDAQ